MNNIDYRLYYYAADGSVKYYMLHTGDDDIKETDTNYISITSEQYATARSDVRVINGVLVTIPREQSITFVPSIKKEIPSPKPVKYNDKNFIEIKNVSKITTLTWIVNNICTNHCMYCPSILHSGTNHHYDWIHAEKFINDFFDRFSNVTCSLSGGEPTVSPFFKPLINLMYDRGGKILLTTNLVRSKDWWDDIKDKFQSVSVSYHPEFMNTEKEDELIDKFINLQDYTRLHVRVMMLPTHWDQCYAFYKKMRNLIESDSLGLSLEMVRVLPNYGRGEKICDISYTDEQNTILQNSPFVSGKSRLRFSKNNYFTDINQIVATDGSSETLTPFMVNNMINNFNADFRGWECDIGQESLFVNWDGSVKRGNCREGGIIGSIVTGINWPVGSVICNTVHCHCPPDVYVSKRIKNA